MHSVHLSDRVCWTLQSRTRRITSSSLAGCQAALGTGSNKASRNSHWRSSMDTTYRKYRMVLLILGTHTVQASGEDRTTTSSTILERVPGSCSPCSVDGRSPRDYEPSPQSLLQPRTFLIQTRLRRVLMSDSTISFSIQQRGPILENLTFVVKRAVTAPQGDRKRKKSWSK